MEQIVDGVNVRTSMKTAAKGALRARPLGALARTVGALRGRALVFVYHRIGSVGPQTQPVVPTVPQHLFRMHLEALARSGKIISLAELVADTAPGRRPKFGITFDDDLPSHVESALPTLRSVGVPATFFLSGRALHGVGPYWFELLEDLIASRGLAEAARLLGIVGGSIDDLIAACENDRGLQLRLTSMVSDRSPSLGPVEIRTLADAGMEIGFHTVDHPALPLLDDLDIETAVIRGRSELETVVGSPVRHFAYPHGRADGRVAAKVRDVGYDTGWTGRPAPIRRKDDRYLLGRWEPGAVHVADLLAGAAARLNAWGTGR